jgi:UDP-GlcNAc:undecaprenyl-phosphate/decaprenyl-phosphate GlcNAc-1-phosphate transferase
VNPWADVPSAIRYPLSFVIPFCATFFLTPLAGRVAHRIGVLDRPSSGAHKTHLGVTPYLGGVAVTAGVIGVALLASGANGELATILACSALLAALGLLDDIRGVAPIVRFSYEGVCGIALWLIGIRAGVFHVAGADLAITVGWVIAVTNAVNFIDNMDGVAPGVAAASALGIAGIAASNGDLLVGSFGLAIAGASLGFLRHNFPPAKIFLGDAGSLLLGFLLAALILKLDLPVGPAPPRALTVLLLAAVPLFDLSVVVIARAAGRRPPWRGGTDHTTHRLKERGWGSREIALAMIGAQAACAVLASFLYLQPEDLIVACLAALAIGWIALLARFLRMPVPVS